VTRLDGLLRPTEILSAQDGPSNGLPRTVIRNSGAGQFCPPLYGEGTLATGRLQVGITALAAILVVLMLAWGTRFLNRERIVTSLS
jgi:hypothetical protein